MVIDIYKIQYHQPRLTKHINFEDDFISVNSIYIAVTSHIWISNNWAVFLHIVNSLSVRNLHLNWQDVRGREHRGRIMGISVAWMNEWYCDNIGWMIGDDVGEYLYIVVSHTWYDGKSKVQLSAENYETEFFPHSKSQTNCSKYCRGHGKIKFHHKLATIILQKCPTWSICCQFLFQLQKVVCVSPFVFVCAHGGWSWRKTYFKLYYRTLFKHLPYSSWMTILTILNHHWHDVHWWSITLNIKLGFHSVTIEQSHM